MGFAGGHGFALVIGVGISELVQELNGGLHDLRAAKQHVAHGLKAVAGAGIWESNSAFKRSVA